MFKENMDVEEGDGASENKKTEGFGGIKTCTEAKPVSLPSRLESQPSRLFDSTTLGSMHTCAFGVPSFKAKYLH